MKTFRNDIPTARRSGFTLVELLVAAALTVLIMTVLATAFQTGMQTLSTLKSVVGLSEQLRTAESILRNDLGGVHLESALGDPVRVSDPLLATNAWTNPGRGYFSVVNGSASAVANINYTLEGSEESVNSYRAVDHSLFFTTKRSGESKQDVYYGDAGSLPATLDSLSDYSANTSSQFVSKWAELGYFLVPLISNNVTNDENGTLSKLKLYTLNRRQRLLNPKSSAVNLTATPQNPTSNPNYYVAQFPEISISALPTVLPNNAQAFVNDPVTITLLNNRMMKQWGYNGSTPAQATGGYLSVPDLVAGNRLSPDKLSISSSINGFSAPFDKVGSDIVLNNVISMQIRVMTKEGLVATQLFQDDLPTSLGAYPRNLDTANGSGIILRAVQIKLRVWDTKNSITRQITITQDL